MRTKGTEALRHKGTEGNSEFRVHNSEFVWSEGGV
jgi:hypothetical protein